LVVVFTICAAGAIGVGSLSVWHGYLIFTNQTTVETYVNAVEAREAAERGVGYRNPFDKGWKMNFCRVFGDDQSLSMLWKIAIPSLRKPPEPDYSLMPPMILEFQPRRR
jgi:hypothetical protein